MTELVSAKGREGYGTINTVKNRLEVVALARILRVKKLEESSDQIRIDIFARHLLVSLPSIIRSLLFSLHTTCNCTC